MNTRGLMELVVLNIGYDLGILGPQIFTMMVFMALITTFMTGPALSLIGRIWPEKISAAQLASGQSLMISFGKANMGAKLLRLVHAFGGNTGTKVSALHVSPITDISPADATLFEADSFAPLQEESKRLQLPVEAIYRANEDIDQEIMDVHDTLQPELLLMGGAETMFREQPMGLKIRKVLAQVECDVLLFTDHSFIAPNRIVVAYYDENDLPLLKYANILSQSAGSVVTVLLLTENRQVYETEMARCSYSFATIVKQDFDHKFLSHFDLLLLTSARWEHIFKDEGLHIDYLPSVLVLQKGKKEFHSLNLLNAPSQVA